MERVDILMYSNVFYRQMGIYGKTVEAKENERKLHDRADTICPFEC